MEATGCSVGLDMLSSSNPFDLIEAASLWQPIFDLFESFSAILGLMVSLRRVLSAQYL